LDPTRLELSDGSSLTDNERMSDVKIRKWKECVKKWCHSLLWKTRVAKHVSSASSSATASKLSNSA
jgi:hypothetical protein